MLSLLLMAFSPFAFSFPFYFPLSYISFAFSSLFSFPFMKRGFGALKTTSQCLWKCFYFFKSIMIGNKNFFSKRKSIRNLYSAQLIYFRKKLPVHMYIRVHWFRNLQVLVILIVAKKFVNTMYVCKKCFYQFPFASECFSVLSCKHL